MLLSQTAEYALRAVLFVAGPGAGRTASADEIARAVGVPPSYLSKTMRTLARIGILRSSRGRTGGFRLARPAGEITLAAVVEPFETSLEHRRCLLERAPCSDQDACAAHHKWKPNAERIRRFFGETTVADLQGR